MLDSGASANLMHPRFADSLNLALTRSRPLKVRLADGSERDCQLQAHGVKLTLKAQLGDYEPVVDFHVADMPGCTYDIILGMPFLEGTNPQVDWVRRIAQITPVGEEPKEIHAVPADEDVPLPISATQLRTVMHRADEDVTVAIVNICQVQDDEPLGCARCRQANIGRLQGCLSK